MHAPAIANRLHRSGAIDFNCEINERQLAIHKDTNPKDAVNVLMHAQNDDELSVCEGEPLYACKKRRIDNSRSVNSMRRPIQCASSINGLHFRRTEVKDVSNDPHKQLNAARDLFFHCMTYAGISVSKWDYRRLGQQQPQFVTTLGGANTIYCDEDCHAGDTLCVDIPKDFGQEHIHLRRAQDVSPDQGGLVPCVPKKGTSKGKRTMTIRPLPSVQIKDAKNAEQINNTRQKMIERGQVIGTCMTGARKGERVDICLAANGIDGSSRVSAGTSDDSDLLALFLGEMGIAVLKSNGTGRQKVEDAIGMLETQKDPGKVMKDVYAKYKENSRLLPLLKALLASLPADEEEGQDEEEEGEI
jgi:hypothetical protein